MQCYAIRLSSHDRVARGVPAIMPRASGSERPEIIFTFQTDAFYYAKRISARAIVWNI
jgi:hypothetical protein